MQRPGRTSPSPAHAALAGETLADGPRLKAMRRDWVLVHAGPVQGPAPGRLPPTHGDLGSDEFDGRAFSPNLCYAPTSLVDEEIEERMCASFDWLIYCLEGAKEI